MALKLPNEKKYAGQSLIPPQNSFLDFPMAPPVEAGDDHQVSQESTNTDEDANDLIPGTHQECCYKEYAVAKAVSGEDRNGRTAGEKGGFLQSFYVCCCCARRRIGDMFVLLETRDGRPLMVVGPCWPFCAFITVPLIIVVSALIGVFVLPKLPSSWAWATYLPILVITLIALFFVSCRDPGLLERVESLDDVEGGADTGDRSRWIWNDQVGSFRPPGAVFCRECKVIIQGYDHVCPWTGTGIGRGNMLAFKFFVVSINILCYYSIGILVFFAMTSIKETPDD